MTELGRGAAIGRYIVLGLLGKGGMGEVYAAYDPELDRKLAVKVLRSQVTAGIDASEGRSRMVREAQALAQLSDPNVVAVYDVGTVGDRVFLAMEFVDGNTLSFWLHAETRTWREIVACYSAAGRGLAAAHRSDLVHRDFKPENVMVGHDGNVRVMDFGLARSMVPSASADAGAGEGAGVPAGLDGSAAVAGMTRKTPPRSTRPTPVAMAAIAAAAGRDWAEGETVTRDFAKAPAPSAAVSTALASPLTITGAMMGTPAYMAPEQFAGQIADTRSDQFSFCVALYEALYSERPFAGRNLEDLTRNVLAGRVCETPANTRVPAWVRKVVLRGLRVDRAERHPSMEALLAALAHDPARTRRRWMAGASVGLLIAGLTGGLIQASQKQKMKCAGGDAKLAGVWELPGRGGELSPRKEAVQRAFMATGKRYAADAFALAMSALDRYVVAWSDMHRDACEATHVRGEQSADVLDLRMSCLADRFAEVRALTSVFSEANGDVVGKAAEAVQGLRPIEQCADITALKAVVRPPDDPAVRRAVSDVRTQLADAKALANAGRYKSALQKIPDIVAAARATKYQPVIAEALLQLAELKGENGDAAEAEKIFEEAVWIAEASRHDEVTAEAADQLIWSVGYFQGRHSEGERWASHANAILQRLGPGHEILAAWRANNLAAVYAMERRLKEALALEEQAVVLKQKVLGPDHPDVAISLDNVAMTLFMMDRIPEAIENNQRALTIIRKTLGPDHPRFADGLAIGAELMIEKGNYDEARRMAEQALAIGERELKPDHPLLADALTVIGRVDLARELPAQALPLLERALKIRELNASESGELGETRFALARALVETGRAVDRALALAQQAREDYRKGVDAQRKAVEISNWIEKQAPHTPISMQ